MGDVVGAVYDTYDGWDVGIQVGTEDGCDVGIHVGTLLGEVDGTSVG